MNISGRSNKFILDNLFRETIFIINKQNNNSFANVKSDKFL